MINIIFTKYKMYESYEYAVNINKHKNTKAVRKFIKKIVSYAYMPIRNIYECI